MKNLIITIAAILLVACEPEIELVRRFTIKKGEHYSTPKLVEMQQSRSLVFEARFDESATYDFGDLALQSNKNKLMGFSDCNSMHHENSARFGWQWMNNQLEIYAYCYVNGQRLEQFLGVVNLYEFTRYEIELTDAHYIFRLNHGEPVAIARGNTCTTGAYYRLWPYFGGHIPAPHDVSIDIKMIY